MGALKLEDLPEYTYNDYIQWEGKWELIHGIAYAMSPAPTIKHQNISAKIARILGEALDSCHQCLALMPIDWHISNETIVQPDNSVICHTPENDAYITKAPKIIFEILSPATEKKDKALKFHLYEEAGVNYYIIVNPIESIAIIYQLQDGKYIKLIETSNETIEFSLQACEKNLKFNFRNIW